MLQTIKRLAESFSIWWGNIYSHRGNLSHEVIDDEMYGWEPLRRESQRYSKELYSEEFLATVRNASRMLYATNCHYRGLIRTYIKYIFGKPFQITGSRRRENKIWEQWKKQIKWRKFIKELGLRLFRDGEVFIWKSQWRFIDPCLVENPGVAGNDYPFGIDCENDDPTMVRGYTIRQGKNFIYVPADEVIHVAEKDSDEKRGLPHFLCVMAKSRTYEKWLGDRMLLNRIRSSIALLRRHKTATPQQIKNFTDAKKTQTLPDKQTSSGELKRQKIFEPGTVLDAGNTEYEFLAPKVEARDVAQDGRNILLAMAAATGLPEFMVAGDASNANFASTMVAEGPAIKEFDYWLEFVADVLMEIWSGVMEQGGIINASEPVITPPNLATRDKDKETSRNETLFQNGVISLQEWRRREEVDDQKMEEEINNDLEADNDDDDQNDDEED